jgi:ATP-dependent DNA ligase
VVARRIDWQGGFPVTVAVIAALPATSLVLDGEAIVLRADGTADFYAPDAMSVAASRVVSRPFRQPDARSKHQRP